MGSDTCARPRPSNHHRPVLFHHLCRILLAIPSNRITTHPHTHIHMSCPAQPSSSRLRLPESPESYGQPIPLRSTHLSSSLSTSRSYVSGQPRRPASQPLKIWPIILIFVTGSASYMYMVKSRVTQDATSKQRGPSITPK